MVSKWKYSLFLALAYIVTGFIGLKLPMFGTSITLIWLPTGISVGILFRYGYACWPGVAVGAFLTNLAIGSPFAVALGIACGNTLGPIAATYLLHRLGFERTFERQREIVLLAIAAVIGMTITASSGVLTLSLTGLIQQHYGQAWLTWWAGDTMGIIAAAPLILVLNRKELRFLSAHRLEFLSWLSAILFLCYVVFLVSGSESKRANSIAFLPLPMMVWAAMRFGATGTSIGVILLSFGAAVGIAHARGPFSSESMPESVIMLWLYMSICAIIGWLVQILNATQIETAKLLQQDVAQRKAVEQSLRESELRFRTLTNHAPVGIFTTDEQGQCTFVNSRWTAIAGLSFEEAKGPGWSQALHPNDRERVYRDWQSAVDTGNEFICDYRFARSDNRISWVHGTATALRDDIGTIQGYVGIITDLSELLHAREVLRLAEEQQRLALDAAALGTWKLEFKSEWIQLDEQSRKIFGLKHPLISRADSVKQIHSEDRERVKAEFAAAYDPDGPRSITSEYRIVWDNGEVRWVSVRAKSYFVEDFADSTPSHLIGAIRDISESKGSEERVRASLREKEAMLKEIHHRVKNNLQIVTSLLSLQAIGNLNPESVSLLQESRNRVRSMALVHETLYGSDDFGRIELASYLDQLCSHLLRSYGIDSSRIHLNLRANKVSLTLERAIPFGLIVNELVSNSLKYAFPDGQSGNILVHVHRTDDHFYMLTVGDDGIGLPDAFDIKLLKSLGLQLVSDLSAQLTGSLTWTNNAGAHFQLKFPIEAPM